MTIRPGLAGAVLAAGAVVLLTAVNAGAAAGLTYRVSAGRASSGTVGFTGKTGRGSVMAPAITFTDTSTSTPIGCTSAGLRGSVPLGRTHSAQLAAIGTTGADHCSAFNGYASLDYRHKGTWHLDGDSKTAHGVTTVSVSDITLVLSSGPCTLTLSGTADGTYSNSTKKLDLQPRTGSRHSLKASGVRGCGGVVNNADKFTLVGVFTLSTRKGSIHVS